MEEPKFSPEEQNAALRMEQTGANNLEAVLVSLRQLGLSERCYAFKARVKTEERILNKLARKRIEKGLEYDLYSISDIVGLRVITLFKQEIIGIIQYLLEIVNHDVLKDNNPFMQGILEEAVIYTMNPQKDDVANAIRELITASKLCGSEPRIEFSNPGYSSVHLVCRLRHNNVRRLKDGYRVPIEIQVRTVFEDAWGEIDHKYGYQKRRETDRPPEKADYLTTKHLRVLKGFVDSCIEYSDLIRDSAGDGSSNAKSSAQIKPIGKDKEIHETLVSVGVREKTIIEYMSLRTILVDGASQIESDIARGSGLLTRAAEGFRQLFNNEKSDGILKEMDIGPLDERGRVFLYYLLMDFALALITLRNRSANRDAELIYQDVRKIIGDHPVILLRSAQALGRAGNHVLAVKRLKDLEIVMDHGATACLTRFKLLLTDADFKHVETSLPKLMGYEYWQIAEQHQIGVIAGLELKIIHLQKAYEKTLDGYKKFGGTNPEKDSYINNLLFYGTEYLLVYNKAKGTTKLKQTIQKKDITALLAEFSPAKDIAAVDNINYLDTLVVACTYVNLVDQAKRAAQRLLTLLEGKVDLGDERTFTILERAKIVLKKQ